MPSYPVFTELGVWLDAYFAGENPPVAFPLAPYGSPFRQVVWRILGEIPYGHTTTYGTIARQLANEKDEQDVGGKGRRKRAAEGSNEHVVKERSSRTVEGQGKRIVAAQAVGGAVGHNPISIVIPCHRVLGSTDSLTGYAGGLDKKIALLELEGALRR
ncbi:MAG: methylated-DNA--[protein]-cysteine S-methyltransferase [Coriobacteriales bacterium]|nr:methylated-DNA--[protein]-cysteine S-methyltransferase [Coriobacteriales bacterium]